MKILADLKTRFERERKAARELHQIGSELTRQSKLAIFEIQRGAKTVSFSEVEKLIKQGNAIVKKFPMLAHEGTWRAGLEEYGEASLLLAFVEGTDAHFKPVFQLDAEIVLGAFSDLIGEMARLAVREATAGNRDRVDAIAEDATHIVGFLTSLDLTGSLRTKGDQARSHLRKIEDIRYDLSQRA